MYAVILAAGMGTRLKGDVPKPLSDIGGGKTLLGNQVDILSRVVGPQNIMLVLGFRAMELIEAFPEQMYVYNARYAETNTAKSLLCGVSRFDDDVLWLNADVYVEEPTIRSLIDSHPGTSRALVNTASTSDEEVKYTRREDGSIRELSKSVKDAEGEAMGVNIVTKSDLAMFCENLARVADQDYFEKALELATVPGTLRLMPVPVGDQFCHEVDFPEDLERVRKHVSGSTAHG